MKFLNWLLYQVHRWVGVVLALFMFVWFFTGLVIMYSTPTKQNRSQQLAHAETLAPEVGWLSLGEAWNLSADQRKAAAEKRKPKATEGTENKSNQPAELVDARLVRSAGKPLWLIEDSRGQRFALSALDGSLQEISPDQALQIAENWLYANADSSVFKASYLDKIDNPVILRNQEALSPFHHIAVDDGGELLISARTGEVLHASTRFDRALYYAGNWLHLFKPLESIGLGNIRHDVQLWSGVFATLATLTGLIIGWLRWRPGLRGKPTYSQGRTQPYRDFWFKWHFWSGLIGGTVMLFWASSGFLDTNPGKIFSQTNPSKQEIARYTGGEFPQAMRLWQPGLPVLLSTAVEGADIVELGWKKLGDEAVLIAHTRDGQRLPQTIDGAQPRFSEASLLDAVERVADKAPVQSQILIIEYDSYYYPRHHQNRVEKPLPVLLVELADEAGTRFYLDPQDGKLLAKVDRSARVFRWVYSALHHWDFGWLYYRPIWDAWMLTWVSFGLVLGATSLVMAWKRLKITFRVKKTSRRYKTDTTPNTAQVTAETQTQTG